MNKPKVSVVVAVYNTEVYVEAALRSIMNQTLRELEIIVIDDGSTDGSRAVVERLAAEDSRIVLLAQSNKGPSEARNVGLDRLRGEFIYFMDSDDLLEADALVSCYDRCVGSQLDFTFFDAETFGADVSSRAWYNYRRAGYFPEESYDGTDLLREMLVRNCYRASACLSFIRKSFLEGLGLRFYPGILHEDELFTAQLYLGAKRVGGIDRAFFRRRLRDGSIMANRFSQRNLDGYLQVLAQLKKYAAAQSEPARAVIATLTRMIVGSILQNAWQLPASKRMRLAATLLRSYPGSISPRLLTQMLVKAPLNKLRGR